MSSGIAVGVLPVWRETGRQRPRAAGRMQKDAGRTRRDLREDGKPWYTISLEFCRAGDLRREEQRPAGRGRGLIWYGRN